MPVLHETLHRAHRNVNRRLPHIARFDKSFTGGTMQPCRMRPGRLDAGVDGMPAGPDAADVRSLGLCPSSEREKNSAPKNWQLR